VVDTAEGAADGAQMPHSWRAPGLVNASLLPTVHRIAAQNSYAALLLQSVLYSPMV
jgi:hypothetical protein